jgi:hypothetical protein
VLTKNDKEWIKETFSGLITEALTVEIMMTRKRDADTGIPLKTPIDEKKTVYLPAHWVEFLPFYEQSIVAMETVTEQSRNRSGSGLKELKQLQEKVNAIGNLYIGLEKPLRAVAALSDAIQNKKLPTMTEVLNLEYAEDSA